MLGATILKQPYP